MERTRFRESEFKGTSRYVGIIGDQMLDELGEIQGTRRETGNLKRCRNLG